MRLEEVFLNDLAQSNLVDMDRPPMRIDITGVGQPTAPEEVGPAPDDLTAIATQMSAGTEPEGATPMSLSEFATTMADVPAGLLKGAVQGTIGLPGDIESISYGVREIFNRGADQGALEAFLTGLEQKTVLPTTENVKTWLDTNVGPLVPEGASDRRREAAKIPEFVGELGGAGKTVIEGTRAIGRGVNTGAMAVADKAVQAITGNPQATAMGALEAAGQTSPVSRVAPKILGSEKSIEMSPGLTVEIAPSVRTKNFKNWFGDSKVVDSKDKPLVVYHGTGNLEGMKSFDPALTGQGLDQLGSGFYFTTNAEEASGYSTKVTQQAGPGAQKLGGDSSPGVVAAYLSIKNPLKIKGSSLRDADIDISSDQAFEILKNSPDIKNMESTPLWNWIDLSGSDEITDDMIMDVAQNYTGSSLISLENDFFRDGATEFRTAIRDVLGYDGVVMEFENGTKHFVAWFPEQIKSAVGNVGTFDPKNPDIARGVVPTAGAAAGAAAMQDNEERM
jgi:hypothetical protein